MRAACGVREGEFVLGILARIEEYKGHLDILSAVKQLREEGRPVRLLIAGTGGFEGTVRARCTEMGLDGCVTFLGFVERVGELLSILDLQLNASYGTETSSLSILEGLSMGVPAVVSDYGGNPWLIDDGEDGLLFRTRDSGDLAHCIARLMDQPELLAQMGRRGQEIFRARFTGEIMARNIESVYQAAMKEFDLKMEPKKENNRPWWRLTLFDIVIIAVVVVIGVVLVWFTGMTGGSGSTGEESQGSSTSGTLRYTIELRQMVGESAYLIQEGDALVDGVRKYNMGTVVSVEVGDSITYSHDMENGTYVPVPVPGYLTATVVVESPYTDNGTEIVVDGGYVIRSGVSVQVRGPGYAGTGEILTLERGDLG